MASGQSEPLTLEFRISDLEQKLDVNELIADIYTDVVSKVDEKDVAGVQVYPRKWPRKVQILCNHLPAKECLIIQGLTLYGRHVELHEPGNGVIKVHIEDAPIDMPNVILKNWISQYATVIEFRNEHVVVNGRRTSWRTGTRHAYVTNVKETIPPVAKFTNNKGVDVMVSIWHYGQSHMKCRWCHEVVPKDHECDKRPKRRCHNCGADDHIKSECRVGKLCYKCQGADHIACDCQSDRVPPGGQIDNHAADSGDSDPSGHQGAPVTDGTADTRLVETGRVTVETSVMSSPGSVILDSPQITSHEKPSVKALLIGGSNCRDLKHGGDDQMDIEIEPLIQGGLTIAEASEKLGECADELKESAQAVILHVGSCDFPVTDADGIDMNYKNYVELLNNVSHECKNAQLVISSVLPRSGKGHSAINEQIRDFNIKLASLSNDEENVMFVDNYVHFTDESGAIEGLYKTRERAGLHLNTDGKQRLVCSFHDALKEAVYKRRYETEWA